MMLLYLIKSTLCLVIILGVYLLVFEKEKMHQFNRWYLLFGLSFSFLIPFMEIQIAIDLFNNLNPSELSYGISDKGIERLSPNPIEDNFRKSSPCLLYTSPCPPLYNISLLIFSSGRYRSM